MFLRMNIKKQTCLFFLFIAVKSMAQTDSLRIKTDSIQQPVEDILSTDVMIDSVVQPVKNKDVVRIVDAFAYTMTSPVRWEKDDWLTAGGVIGGTMLLSLADKPVYDLMNNNRSRFFDNLGEFGYHNGKPYAAAIVAGGFYATGWIINDEWTKETAAILTSAYLTSGVLQSSLKKIVGRARPSEGLGNYEFHPFKNDPGFSSFPSGHSQIAFVTAMVLAERVDKTWLKAVFYTGAAVTIASRMYANAHWITDVTFGSVLGYFCTKMVIKRFEQNKYGKAFSGYTHKNKIKWQIIPSYNGVGVIGTF